MEKLAKELLRERARRMGDGELLKEGVRLFNRGEFFEAHETWEELWRRKKGAERELIQGLVQMAVALAHARSGNEIGFRSVMERGLGKAGQRRTYRGLDVAGLVQECREALEGPFPPAHPKITKVRR